MAVIGQSIFRTLDLSPPESDLPSTIIVTGKGGVGKSTTLAAIAKKLRTMGFSVLIADLDGSPNATDSFGYPEEIEDRLIEKNDVFQIADGIHCVLLRNLVPEIPFVPRELPQDYAKRLNDVLDPLTNPNIHPFLPILRPASMSEFFGFPANVEQISMMISLVTILQEQRHIVTDTLNNCVEVQQFDRPDFVLIDTENTNNALKTLNLISLISHSMRNLAAKGAIGKLALPANLKSYTNTPVGKDPEEFICAAEKLRDHIADFHTKLVMVTGPGGNQVSQALREMRILDSKGKSPNHVFMNHWPENEPDQQIAHAQVERFTREGERATGGFGYSQAAPSIVHPVLVGSEYFQRDTLAKLDRLIECL